MTPRAPAVEVERAILARLGASENGQVHAWVNHAVGQMRSARAAKARLLAGTGTSVTRMVVSDCVACARECRRVARSMRTGGGR